ncbi:MAG TPA: CPBP family intramembrane metalloprotease, partial [Candidatus Marinimicrobia bacterium]|nr:CPBP family intramembrane metalloprotease [Candidatus Neomarinimicrobiota bacterium]
VWLPVYLIPGRFPALQAWSNRVLAALQMSDAVYLFWGIGIAILLSILFTVAEISLSKIQGASWDDRLHNADFLLPQTQKQKQNAALINISASTVEEILFRAYFFLALLNLWTHWLWAALLVSAVFALLHTNFQGFTASVWIFISSLILVWLLQTSGSIWPGVLLHFVLNSLNLFILPKMLGDKQ